MVPFSFPILLIVPAFAADLVVRALRHRNDWLVAAAVAIAFTGVLLATSWYSAQFLISPSADNAFFIGARHFPYFERPGKWVHEYWYVDTDRLTVAKLAASLGLAFLSTRLGLMRGKWLRQVVR
jgi:phosphoglycerol transferase MdoB-like AlkP superfamily enzyme